MSRWENKYNEIMPNIDNMIKEQNDKMNEARRKQAELGKNVESAEYKEQKAELNNAKIEKQRLDQLKLGLDKVTNIMDFRKQVEKRLNEYYKVKDVQDKINNNTKIIQRKEQKIEKASHEIEDLKSKLQSGTLSQDEKSKVNAQITRFANERQNAYNENIQLKRENKMLEEDLKGLQYGDLDKKQINAQIKKLGSTIVKCDMACSNLMNGKKAEDIQFDKSKHKYTRPKQEKVNDEKNNEKEDFELPEIDYSDINFELTFSDKHPWIAKAGKFFKNIKDKILRKDKKIELPAGKEFETEKTERKEPEEKEEINLTDKVMDRMVEEILDNNAKLDELGTKGTKRFRDEIKVAISNEAKEKLDQMRAANRANEAQKFGQDYADKSDFRTKNDDEGR